MPDINMLRRLAAKIKKIGEEKNYNDAMGGGYGTTGSHWITQAEYFIDGLNQIIPAAWTSYYKELVNETDPEYKEFLRLSEKFK